MFETIIVPLDGSSTAEVALPYAIEVAGRMGSNLDIIFVREANDYRSPNIIQCYLDNTAQKAQQLVRQFLPESGLQALDARTTLLTGNPAEEIIRYAESRPGSHIIMATHGQSGASSRWALGSVADKVVRASLTPVGIIRAKDDKPEVNQPVHLKHILAPLDGSKESESALPYVMEMAMRLKAEVTLLQVAIFNYVITNMENVRAMEEARNKIQMYLSTIADDFHRNGIETKQVVRDGFQDAADEINAYTRDNHMDVVIMATHGRSGPRRWLLGSMTNKVMMEGNTPLVVVRTPGPFREAGRPTTE